MLQENSGPKADDINVQIPKGDDDNTAVIQQKS